MQRVLTISLATLLVALLAGAAWLYTPDKPRAALEAEYAAPPSRFIEVLGIRLHLRDTGPRDAPAMILLHGFGASLQTWDDCAGPLSADHRVVRFDLPGFGLTGPDPSGDYSDQRSMAVLAALMDQLGMAHATIVGHSMGGRIAWHFAAAYPARVNRLVLIAPDGFASPDQPYDTAVDVPLMVRLLPYVLPTPMLRASLAPAYARPESMTDTRFARYRDMMLAPGVRGAIVARMAQNILVDPESLLRRIKVPTLLLWGERDCMIPISNAADYLRDIKGARLVTFPNVGHLLQEDAPAQTVASLQGFVVE